MRRDELPDQAATWLGLLRAATALRHYDDPQHYWQQAHQLREALDSLPGAHRRCRRRHHEPASPPASRTITKRRPGDGYVTVPEAMAITRRERKTLYDWSYKHRLTVVKLAAPGSRPHRGAPLLFVEAELRQLFKLRPPLRP